MNLSALMGSGFKSVQRGVVAVTAGVTNVTITSVNTNKAFLNLLSVTSTSMYMRLSSATNIEINASSTVNISWELLEFN